MDYVNTNEKTLGWGYDDKLRLYQPPPKQLLGSGDVSRLQIQWATS